MVILGICQLSIIARFPMDMLQPHGTYTDYAQEKKKTNHKKHEYAIIIFTYHDDAN